MTDRYVGPGGSDGASGLTWALRKETLNGVEDTPVVAGDTIYVGPGVYRETLQTDVAGSSGSPITYIGDVTGENTDGVGGLIRITGSDDDGDIPNTRDRGINIGHNYRTFESIYLEEIHSTGDPAYVWVTNNVTDWILDSLVFGHSGYHSGGEAIPVWIEDETESFIIRNCIFLGSGYQEFFHRWQAANRDAVDSIFENNIMRGSSAIAGVSFTDIFNVTFRNNTFRDRIVSVSVGSIGGADQVYANNNIFSDQNTALNESGGSGYITGDYNTYAPNNSGLEEGANSIFDTWITFQKPTLLSGYKFPYDSNKILDINPDIFEAGNSGLTSDVFGTDKHGKDIRGAIQFYGAKRTSGEYRTAPSSAELIDTSKHIITIPATPGATYQIKAYVKRETNYVGTNPQLVLKAPSVADVTATDAGSSGAWNKLQETITLGSNDKFLQVEVRSSNTATSGDYSVFVDDLTVKQSGGKRPVMKWITNEMPLFSFDLDEVVDPWIIPTIPTPGGAPTESSFYPKPSFFRP